MGSGTFPRVAFTRVIDTRLLLEQQTGQIHRETPRGQLGYILTPIQLRRTTVNRSIPDDRRRHLSSL